jgi:hypothetical protein
MKNSSKPKVLFAIGDADWKYTRGKFHRLVDRVILEDRFDVSVATHDPEIHQCFANKSVETFCLPGSSLPLAPEHSVTMTELMIRLTRDVVFPDSRLHIWKVMAMDDYLGCVDVITQPALPIKPDLVVYPLMGIDNNSTSASRLYSAILLEAPKTKAPVVGLEVSLLGNKQSLGASLADSYAVKSEFSRSYVLGEELAPADRVAVLPPEEIYLLTCRDDAYWDDFFLYENDLRQRFGINRGRPVIFMPHHVGFVYEIRQLLRSLKSLPFPFSLILRADPNIARQGLKERDIAERVYQEEIAALPHVIVDDQGGWLWGLLLADVVLAPVHSVFTELASIYGKLTVISQGWGERSWVSDNLYIEPHPGQAVNTIHTWIKNRVLPRRSLTQMISAALEAKPAVEERGAPCEA